MIKTIQCFSLPKYELFIKLSKCACFENPGNVLDLLATKDFVLWDFTALAHVKIDNFYFLNLVYGCCNRN